MAKKGRRAIKNLYGLKQVREVGVQPNVLCPKCGNALAVVPNGFWGGEVFFCMKEEKVFTVMIREVKPDPLFVKQSKEEVEAERVRRQITRENYYKAKVGLEGK